jgi:glycosyltransferase involved in cell wall biosynthesis
MLCDLVLSTHLTANITFTMHIVYILLSPTFGMHQYTADLANRGERWNMRTCERVNVDLITTTTLPRDRYDPAVTIHTPVTTHGTGFSREGLDLRAYHRIWDVPTLQRSNVPTVIHFTGVHAWNLPLVYALRRRGATVIHTLHDLDPHHGVRFPALIRLWNRLILASGAHILVHGRCYRERLLAQGLPPARVTATPLLHGFWGYDSECQLSGPRGFAATPTHPRSVIFFGRLEMYKGIDTLLAAWALLNTHPAWSYRLILAGALGPGAARPTLPPGVELRPRRIPDAEALELFRQASLLVLPYRDATQSALIAAAYRFSVPVIVTRSGALPEAVVEGVTGWVVPPNDPAALAAAVADALSDLDRLRAFGLAGQAWFVRQRQFEEETLSTLYLAKTDARPQATKRTITIA